MTLNEKILWLKFKSGDKNALGEIFHYYFKDLYFYGLKFVSIPDVVKDVIQDMFIRFWNDKEKLRKINNIKSYLLVSLRRDLIRWKKKNRIEAVEGNDIKLTDFHISPEDLIIENEERYELHNLLILGVQKLSPRQQEVIFYRFYNDLDFNELSEVLEMNIQSVRNLLFRSLDALRKELR
jgi:RNA polymerase sigma factor (sigma-70 family)